MNGPDIVSPVALRHTQQVTCTPRWYVQNTEYPPAIATYQPLINGEETFKAVHSAIAQATKTVDIICWGFQPSMYFVRNGIAPSIGELLKNKAREGVKVRVLVWEMPLNSAGFAGEANLPGKSTRMRHALRWTASHHQKSVLVDYELPDRAVGFVMGHNMLDAYWDTDKHSALNRSEGSKPAPNRGPRGATPRQDISSQVSGPILEHLHHNFASAWLKETGEDLLDLRQAKQIGPQLQCSPGVTRQMAQVLRTQAQAGKRDIEQVYLNAVNNATQFIYIENQYFRWPPLAEAIKKAASDQTGGGRDPGVHGALHLFVITNATDDGIGAGTVNTQRMLESLGRADTIANVTKRLEQVKGAAPPRPTPDPRDHVGQRELAKWQAELDQKIKEIEDSTIIAQEVPGLKVHICSLVAPDSPAGKPWVPVYIHSKLMIVDDVFTTLGSANINTRSMQVDSELNIAHEWMSVTQALRRRLWDLHTDGRGAQDDPAQAFKAWTDIIKENKERQSIELTPKSALVGFYYGKATLKDLD
ncbi:phospholipase D-like domain-containing protein [Pseudomonas spelaei]